MTRYLMMALVVLAFSQGALAGDKAHPASTAKWKPLFKADLSNAKFKPGVWTVEDGTITASEDKCMWTKTDYENFVLDLEFKTGDNANSGVIIYCTYIQFWIPNSLEIQVQDDFGKKWKSIPDNWRCGGMFGHLAPTKRVVKKPGEWNRMTIYAKGQQVDVVLNGTHTASMDMSKYTSNKTNPDGSKIPGWLSNPLAKMKTKGRIGFQGKHGGAAIWFRNIKIKEMK